MTELKQTCMPNTIQIHQIFWGVLFDNTDV